MDEKTRRKKRLKIFLEAIFVIVVCYLGLFNLSVVRGSSMTPHIHDGDRIFLDQVSYVFSDIHRGDIVIFKCPLEPRVDYVKRVIGLPYDDVVLENGHVLVNGRELYEPYIQEQDQLVKLHIQVPSAHYFVLGDNRPRSSDSREFGLVPQDYIRSKVVLRVWPLDRFGSIE